MRPPETFTTARLFARPPRPGDAASALESYAGDPVATRYLSWRPYSEIPPLAEFFAARARDWAGGALAPGSHYAWLLFTRGTEALVGSISVLPERHKALFGYVLGRAYWRHGYAAEALAHLVEWALAQPPIHRAWAYCDVENPASARVMEKAGMAREGILRRWHVCPTIGPEPRDCITCARTR
ncbi:GNAT family N-acetyltransferase [Termitidicoccus mucosus]|uniref:N-acetyltransferase domain-containing protein n=1 Tax=Termitidicoccus mucosus TaxID=1184151 RepID=A0A178IH28_9BACT|nr:hypothetical protein AW736_16650 [Opitutaceae bacterium TSB47]